MKPTLHNGTAHLRIPLFKVVSTGRYMKLYHHRDTNIMHKQRIIVVFLGILRKSIPNEICMDLSDHSLTNNREQIIRDERNRFTERI